jgi:hypothetical protein
VTLESEAHAAADLLAKTLDREGYEGWDPYDALSSPLLGRVARGRALRIGAVQTLKRCPVNLRPVLFVPRQAHTKALALFASAYAIRVRTGDGDAEWYRSRARRLADLLIDRAVEVDSGVGWGYDFDVQTRWGSYGRNEPNAVATAFVGQALLDVAELGEGDRYREQVDRAVAFAGQTLARRSGEDQYFAYYRDATRVIHNASLLVAGLCFRATPESEAGAVARAAVSFAVRSQHEDGTWPYGEGDGLGWVDGFHTAYVVEVLGWWAAQSGDATIRAAAERGLEVYVKRLVDPDGAARATLQHRYPIDIHAAATGITTLSRLRSLHPRADETADRMLVWALEQLRRHDGRFAFQRHRLYRNSVPYVRWSDGHMMLALAAYLNR